MEYVPEGTGRVCGGLFEDLKRKIVILSDNEESLHIINTRLDSSLSLRMTGLLPKLSAPMLPGQYV